MAGDWGKWVFGLPDKPEVLNMAEILGISNFEVAARLIDRVWRWAGDNIGAGTFDEQGNASVALRAQPASVIDGLAGVAGFAAAMSAVGWLTIRDGRISLPHFDRHNGKPGKDRALAKDRMSRVRQKHVARAAQPEKRREEKSNTGEESPVTPLPLPPKNGFAKPTLEEVRAYCLERGSLVDPEVWFNHYESNGWRVGRNPMRDWKAAVRTWEKNSFRQNGNNGHAKPELFDGIKAFVERGQGGDYDPT